jgi:hypothetical protein
MPNYVRKGGPAFQNATEDATSILGKQGGRSRAWNRAANVRQPFAPPPIRPVAYPRYASSPLVGQGNATLDDFLPSFSGADLQGYWAEVALGGGDDSQPDYDYPGPLIDFTTAEGIAEAKAEAIFDIPNTSVPGGTITVGGVPTGIPNPVGTGGGVASSETSGGGGYGW